MALISTDALLIVFLPPGYSQEPSRFPSQNPQGIVSGTTPIVRVTARDAQSAVPYGQSSSCGTGTIIYDDGTKAAVYTNWHVIKDSTPPIIVHTADGRSFQATIFFRDELNDLAALQIRSAGIKPAEIAPDPNPQGMLTVGGYGEDGRLKLVSGPREQVNFTQAGQISTVAIARQGDSGGPAFRSDGKMIGVLWGGYQGRTMIVSGEPFTRFHRAVISPAGEQVSLTRWSGGACQSCPQGSYCDSTGCYPAPSMSSVPMPTQEYSEQARIPGIKPLREHPEIVSIHNELNQFNQSLSSIQKTVTTSNLTQSSACSCEGKWTALDKKLEDLGKRIDGIKPCTCGTPAPDQSAEVGQLKKQIDDLQNTINDLKQKPPSAEPATLTLEGIVKRVPK